MTPIAQFLRHHFDLPAMDLLQGAGIISDLCVMPEDIAQADQPRAVAWLVDYVRKNGRFVESELLL